jgi:hypothetical protein
VVRASQLFTVLGELTDEVMERILSGRDAAFKKRDIAAMTLVSPNVAVGHQPAPIRGPGRSACILVSGIVVTVTVASVCSGDLTIGKPGSPGIA